MSWTAFVLKQCLWQAESSNSFSLIENNLISNLNRPFSSRDCYSEQMHITADSIGPGIVVKAILSKKLSFWRLKVFLLTISIKGHHLPFTYSQMSLKFLCSKRHARHLTAREAPTLTIPPCAYLNYM